MESIHEDTVEEQLFEDETIEEDLDCESGETPIVEDDDDIVTDVYDDSSDNEHDPIKIMERQIQQVQYWRPPLKGSKHKWMPSVLEMD